jgi:hypothetical protein
LLSPDVFAKRQRSCWGAGEEKEETTSKRKALLFGEDGNDADDDSICGKSYVSSHENTALIASLMYEKQQTMTMHSPDVSAVVAERKDRGRGEEEGGGCGDDSRSKKRLFSPPNFLKSYRVAYNSGGAAGSTAESSGSEMVIDAKGGGGGGGGEGGRDERKDEGDAATPQGIEHRLFSPPGFLKRYQETWYHT